MLQTRHWSRPLLLIYDIIPFTLVSVWGCPYHDKLPFCHLLLITLSSAPHLPLAATCSIVWSVCPSVPYIKPNTSPKELQLSSLGYLPSLRDEPLEIPTCPVITCASRHSIHSYHSRPSSGPITSRFASWLHHRYQEHTWFPRTPLVPLEPQDCSFSPVLTCLQQVFLRTSLVTPSSSSEFPPSLLVLTSAVPP